MTKLKFLLALNEKLADYPQAEVEERLSFYSEMIEDRMEEGLTEEEAVAAVGSVDEIAAQIASELSSEKNPEKKKQGSGKPKWRLTAWEIVLLLVGSPLWISLLAAVFAVGLSLYVSLWAVVIALWAVFASLVVCAVGMTVCGIGVIVGGYGLSGIAMIGAGFVCGGISVFLFYGCKAANEGTVVLTKVMASWFKKCFLKKEVA